jgi:hypothetical protein
MNYTNMAMVWAEIVLHKDVDWRTIYATKLEGVNRKDAVIATSWTQPSDCMPEWSNRGQFGFPAIVMPDAEDAVSDDDEGGDDTAPVTFGATHERREAREDIEYEQQMREAMRRSVEDRGPQYGFHGYSGRDRGSYSPQGGADGSSQEGSQYYSGSFGGAYYGHSGGSYYTGSNEPAPSHGTPIPPPTFGGPHYGNYGQGSSRSTDVYGGGPYMGIYGGGSSAPTQRDETDSDSE